MPQQSTPNLIYSLESGLSFNPKFKRAANSVTFHGSWGNPYLLNTIPEVIFNQNILQIKLKFSKLYRPQSQNGSSFFHTSVSPPDLRHSL